MVACIEIGNEGSAVGVSAEAAADEQGIGRDVVVKAGVVIGVCVGIRHGFGDGGMVGTATYGGQVGGEQAAATTQRGLCGHDGCAGHAPAGGNDEQASGVAFVRKAPAGAVLVTQPGSGEPTRSGGGIGEGVAVKVDGNEFQSADVFFVFLPE